MSIVIWLTSNQSAYMVSAGYRNRLTTMWRFESAGSEYGEQVQILVLANGVWCPAIVVQPESRHTVVVKPRTGVACSSIFMYPMPSVKSPSGNLDKAVDHHRPSQQARDACKTIRVECPEPNLFPRASCGLVSEVAFDAYPSRVALQVNQSCDCWRSY